MYLKDYIYYSELYDCMTINECECWDSEVHDAYVKSGAKFDPQKPSRKLHGGLIADLNLHFIKGERYAGKEDAINKWMQRDRAIDEKLENAVEPKGVRCFHCSSSQMTCISRDLMNYDNDKDEVLFMFQCKKCSKRRAYWENGREWQVKPVLCEKCKSEMKSNSIKKEDVIETTHSCSYCNHKVVDSFNLSSEVEAIDPNFELKRKKYCFSKEKGQEYIIGKMHLESATKLMEKAGEREQDRELYDAIASIKKLAIIELQNLLDPIIEKAGYVKFQLSNPEISKDVIVPFGVYDSKSNRSGMTSAYDLKRLLKKTLKDTNWRLMSDGVSYRLGYLQGRLRGVEGEENLLKLVDNKKYDRKNRN